MKKYMRVQIKLTGLILLSFFSSCRMTEYYDKEQHLIELGYQKSEAIMDGIYGTGTACTTFEYEFKVGDTTIRIEKCIGQQVNTDLVRIYEGARFEILYKPSDFEDNLVLMNKPVFNDNQIFKEAEGEILYISRRDYKNMWFGFFMISVRYYVEGRVFIHRGGISKDLFFPDKDYNEITRKELKELKRKYKGQKCVIEYDVKNPGISRLVEKSVVIEAGAE